MSDDFLAQIKQTETEAQKMIDTALERKKMELQKERQRLAEAHQTVLTAAREEAKAMLAAEQKEWRVTYNRFMETGQKEAQIMEKEALSKMEKMMPTALSYLMNELI